MSVLARLLPLAPCPALSQQGLDGCFTNAVALGEHVRGCPASEALHERGQVLLAQPVAQAASAGDGRARGLDRSRWLTMLDRFATVQQVGAESRVQIESRHPDQGRQAFARSLSGPDVATV